MNIDPPDSIALSGGFVMEFCYEVIRGNTVVGEIRLMEQGLYCKMKCNCTFHLPGIYRLHLECLGIDRNLGVLIPDGNRYSLETAIPTKYIDYDHPTFYISGMDQTSEDKIVSVDSDMPFSYIRNLEKARFVYRNGKAKIYIDN